MIKQMKPKTKKRVLIWTRGIIQLLFFVLFPSAFTSAFSGIKNIFNQMNSNAPIEFNSFMAALLAVCIFTVIFGRFFCGFACAFGTVGDALHAIYLKICKKLKKKTINLKPSVTIFLSSLKYLVLISVVAMCFFGVYDTTRGWSPWDVFSIIRAGNFRLSGYTIGLVLLIVIFVGMTICERFFCRFFCPMGAIFTLLPILPIFSLHRNRQNCIKGCKACERICPSDIKLSDKNERINGSCFQCQKCISTCPKQNISTNFSKLKGNEIWFTLIRAALLAAIFIWVGI